MSLRRIGLFGCIVQSIFSLVIARPVRLSTPDVSVCPVVDCITMETLTEGVDERTGRAITGEKMDWTAHPNNPMRRKDP